MAAGLRHRNRRLPDPNKERDFTAMTIAGKVPPPARQKPDSTITFLTQDEVRRLFSVIKSK
jgi:hypothetical protein